MNQHSENSLNPLSESQKKIIRGWCFYDWANSAFATSAAVAILPYYFVELFEASFGTSSHIGTFSITGSSIWALGVALSTAVVAISSPILGIIADKTPIKKRLLWIYTIIGSGFTILSFFSSYIQDPWAWIMLCFFIANIGFAGGCVFYNAFLPHLAPRQYMDEISSRGFAYGYLGGGLLLAIHLVLILIYSDTNYTDLVTRLCIASVGVWWFGWSLWTFKTVPEPVLQKISVMSMAEHTIRAIRELKATARELFKFRVIVLYLIAYFLFNDGIQTVLSIAGAFAADTLGVSLLFNMITILLIQFIAAPGAIIFGKIAKKKTTKNALIASLMLWCIVITFGVGIAPLEPQQANNYDYLIRYEESSQTYRLDNIPDFSSSDGDKPWVDLHTTLINENTISRKNLTVLVTEIASSDESSFSLLVEGGTLDGTSVIGPQHPSHLGDGLIDWWPSMLRNLIWQPLGISSNIQWMLMGVVVGLIMGGSQALARSIFAYIIPISMSGQFFGFFGLVSRVSAVFGPMLYLFLTGIFDTRVAVFAIFLIILIGTFVLKFVNVTEGKIMAEQEDKERLS